MSTPAERLKAARVKAGFKTATAAAKAYGWTESTYLGHENGSRGLPVDAAQRYGRAFGTPWEQLLAGSARISTAEYGTPILGIIGFPEQEKLTRETAHILPVGAEGYDFNELAAFVAQYGQQVHYLIASIIPEQTILVGDEVVISTDQVGGRTYSSWLITETNGQPLYMENLGNRAHGRMLGAAEFKGLPGLSVEGVVVATYVDKQRRKTVEARLNG